MLVLVYNQENKIFLQRRSNAKQLFPGRWDLSATGHVQAGESREEAAIRELEEELGLRVERLTLREEVPARIGSLTTDGRDENDRFRHIDDNGAVRLASDAASFQGYDVLAVLKRFLY